MMLRARQDSQMHAEVDFARNTGSDWHVYNKFKKEFERVIENMKAAEEGWSEEAPL